MPRKYPQVHGDLTALVKLSPLKLFELFETVDDVLYRKLEGRYSPWGMTRDQLNAQLDLMAKEMEPNSVLITVEVTDSYGDVCAWLVVSGRRPATDGERALYDEVKGEWEEFSAAQRQQRDEQMAADLKKRRPDLFQSEGST